MFAAVGAVKPHRTAFPLFVRNATKALNAAKSAPGCSFAETTFRDGLAFSLTVWDRPEDMAAYAKGPGHRPAMRWAKQTGEVFHFTHFEVQTVPSWNDAVARWERDLHAASRVRS